MATPGAPTVWCFGSGSGTDLSVTVGTTSICVYVVKTDHDETLESASELVAWLKAHRPGAFSDPRSGVLNKLKGGKLFRWE
jgi:hypothetical protein